MLIPIRPSRVTRQNYALVPAHVLPLYNCAARDQGLEECAQEIVESLGFDSYAFAITSALTVRSESRIYYSTSASPDWVAEYDQNSYVEVDPRLTYLLSQMTPLTWDESLGHDNSKAASFLDRAACFGIGSGVSLAIRAEGHIRALFHLNHRSRTLDAERTAKWVRSLGDIMIFGVHFYGLFVHNFIKQGIAPLQQGAPLSRREKECLLAASRGLTSADIGQKVGITERTVHFHFGNIISKLAAGNRSEAIATALARGMIGT